MGKRASALAGKGVATDRASTNDQIAEDNQEHFDYLVRRAGLEGKSAPAPSQEATTRSRRVLNTESAGLPSGLELRGVSGVHLQHVLLSSHGLPEQQAPVSLAERIADALRDVEEISKARADLAMEKIRSALEWVQQQLSRQSETTELRQWITTAVLQVRALKNLIVGRARRLLSVKRATRLNHMAEQEWERFNSDYPLGSTCYSKPEWTQRRGRRLSVLEKRAAELKSAQERSSEGELGLIDAEILRKADLLEALPHPPEAPTSRAAASEAVAPCASVPRLPVPRGPAFH